MAPQDDRQPDGRRMHYLVPFLVPFTLACVGSVDMLMLARTEWGQQNPVPRFAVTLGAWALAAFVAYRAATANAPIGALYWRICAFAFLSGALCAAEPNGGFLFVEAVFSAFVVTTVSLQTFDAGTVSVPPRVWAAAVGEFLSMAAVMLANDLDLSLYGATGSLVMTLFLLGGSFIWSAMRGDG